MKEERRQGESGAWALVTGASSGIGAATARALAREGYHLVLLARRESRLQGIGDLIIQDCPSTQVRLLVCDVRDKSRVDQVLSTVSDVLGSVRVLVNNAGLARGTAKLQDSAVEDWERMIDTNVKGLLYVSRHVLSYMLQSGRGHVVNIGSVAGRWVYPGGTVYCASKFAVRALSEGMRSDLVGTGIRVTNLEPGMVETEFSEVRLAEVGEFPDARAKARAQAVYQGMTPLSPEDIGEAIVWCLSRPAHVNVQEMVIFPTDQASVHMVNRRGQ